MGTKHNPGNFDCYEEADPDEPMFVLLGRDPFAPALVRIWADLRSMAGDDPAKVGEAFDCARAMGQYLKTIGRTEVDCHTYVLDDRLKVEFGSAAPIETLKGRGPERQETP